MKKRDIYKRKLTLKERKTIIKGYEKMKKPTKKKYKCPWCGKLKVSPSIICSCEVKDTYRPWED